MSIPIVVIVVGVSEYQGVELEDLPAAQADSLLFAQSLRNWGVSEQNIYLFLNDGATKEILVNRLQELKQLSHPFKLVFYYCGHGYRSAPPEPNSYLLLHQSQINLDSLLSEIYQLNARENYLFIDACGLRINSLINPELEREIQKKKIPGKAFFCLLSSGIDKSYEDIEEEYGYFTSSLMQSLSTIRQGDNSPTVLLEKICAELRQKGLPLPEMYNIETHRIDFFPELSSGLPRMPVIAKIQDLLIQNPKKILCLIGEKGIGKTTLCKRLISEKCYSFYFEQIPPFEQLPPYSLIVIDGIETRESKILNYLIEKLVGQKMKFILTTRKSFKSLLSKDLQEHIQELEIPPFDFEETNNLINKKDLDTQSKELIFLASRGNPQKIKNILFDSSNDFFKDADRHDIKKAIAAITACGMYLNEELFCRIYGLKSETLAFIEEIGLISSSKNMWIPDERLFDIAESEDLPIDHIMALKYWCRQIDETPGEPQAAKCLILTAQCLGYIEEIDHYLLKAFEILKSDKDEKLFFFDGAEMFLSNGVLSKTALFLADVLLRKLGEIEKAETLLSLPSKNSSYLIKVKMRKSQCLWRKGQFKESKKEFSILVDTLPHSSQWIESLLNRGIASFFLGDWEEALKDFSLINKKAKDTRYLGWARCMLGSIVGLRGIDTSKGKEFLESGISLLIKSQDLTAPWVGWNNLGEMLWKLGEFRSSAYHLQKALEIAINPSTKLETMRNLLQLNLRAKGPLTKEVDLLLEEIEATDLSSIEKYEKMQLLNTLTFAFLLRGETKKAIIYLQQVVPLTVSNREYHLSTLSNLAFLFKMFNLESKSEYYQSRMIYYANKESHFLAIDLIKKDLVLLEGLLKKPSIT